MKVLLLLFFVSIVIYSQENKSLELVSNKINELETDAFISLVKASNIEIKVIYTFATWCKPCVENLPAVIDITNNKKVDFYLATFEKSNSNEYKILEKYFEKPIYDNYPSIYNVRNPSIKNFRKNYLDFTTKLIPNHEDYGLSLIIVLNKDNEVLYASNWNETKEEKIENLKESLLN